MISKEIIDRVKTFPFSKINNYRAIQISTDLWLFKTKKCFYITKYKLGNRHDIYLRKTLIYCDNDTFIYLIYTLGEKHEI